MMARTLRTDREKATFYGERVKAARNEFEGWYGPARDRVLRYRNLALEEDFTQEGHRVSSARGLGTIDAMFSSLTAVDVEVNIQPWGKGTIDQARVAEQAVMEVWREAKVGKKSRRAVKDALLVGIGWVKVGYDYAAHKEVQPKDPARLDAELGDLYKLAVDAGEEPPDPLTALDIVGDSEEVEIVDRDRVVVDYLHWQDVVWDPSARSSEDIRWIAQITYLPIDEVRSNPDWREYVKKTTGSYKALEDLKPDSVVHYEGEEGTERSIIHSIDPDRVTDDDDNARVAIVEYWNLSTLGGTFCTLPLNSDFLLNEQVNPLGFEEDMEDRNPFVPLVTRDAAGKVRGISDMEVMVPNLQEMNRYRSTILNYIETYRPKLLGKEGGLTEPGKDALHSRTDDYVEYDKSAQANDFQPLQPPMLPTQAFQMPAVAEQEIKEATGVSEVQRGVFPDRKRTATETAEVVSASSARQSEKRNLMEEFYGNIARRILHMMQTFYDEARISRLVDTEGDILWNWTNEDVTMDVALEVVLAPKQPRDSVWREERALKLVNFVAPIISQPALHPLARLALKEMGYSMEVIRTVLPTEEELARLQQEQAQQEADAAGMQAEAAAVGQASGDPAIPGGVNGPPDEMSLTEQMGPPGIYADAAAQVGASATGFLPGP
jgi:hypothetical protein